MYGWRCRIGLVYPAVVAETLLTEFFRIVPDGVTMAMTQLSIGILHEDDIMRAASEMDRAIGYLAERHVDCIVAAGAPIIRRLGAGSDTDLIERAERETGIPTTTSQTAALDAFKALGVGRIAVASPYHEDQDERVRSFLETSGLEVATIDGMRKDVAEIHNISLGDAYHHAKRTYFRDPTAEAIYVPCGHFTVPDVPTLEAETGVPVITSTSAMVWAGLRMGNVRDQSLARHGRLFSTLLPQTAASAPGQRPNAITAAI